MRKYKGQVVAVDTYCWLHKGAVACAEKLAKGEPTDKRRQANLLKGKQLLREGKVSEARECFTRSINITHAMAHNVIKVILKMDQFGNGLEVDQARLGMCKQLGDVFTEEKVQNVKGTLRVIKKIGHYLKMNITVPEDYIKGFIRANNTFLYQLVFDPIKRKLIPLNAYEDDIDPETLSYAGRYVDDSIALQIALGNKDINTFEQIDDYNPDTAVPAQSRSHSWTDKTCQKSSNINSIWHKNYCPRLELDIVSDATKVKENPSTVGIELVISTKGLNLPRKSSIAKRPRSEELSEDDLLGQYSTSFTKKIKKNSCEGNKLLNSSERFMPDLVDGTTIKKSLSTPPRRRNKFATFLQRKNEESGAVVVPGTRSSLEGDTQNIQYKDDLEHGFCYRIQVPNIANLGGGIEIYHESDCNFKSLDNQGNQKSKLHLFHFSKKDTLLRNKICIVPGLYKSSSVDNLSTTKIKPLVPARVSGLSKKPSSIHKRNHHNAENKPGLQIKINELWKNFVFK
ncbi:hypothetical protein E2I00_018390, partial [Balaenoptera physalus]